MVGRFLGSAIFKKCAPELCCPWPPWRLALLVCISMLTTGTSRCGASFSWDFFNSVMFPSIFTLGIAKLGPLTGDGSGILIMAIVGGAIMPVLQGALADRIGIHHAFIIPAVCYLYILFYALRGSRPVEVS